MGRIKNGACTAEGGGGRFEIKKRRVAGHTNFIFYINELTHEKKTKKHTRAWREIRKKKNNNTKKRVQVHRSITRRVKKLKKKKKNRRVINWAPSSKGDTRSI